MGKKNKKSKKSTKAVEQEGQHEAAAKEKEIRQEERVITMKALQEMSDSDDSDGGELPPEEEWDDDAKALRDAIENGAFEKLLNVSKKKHAADGGEEEESIEEVVLDSDGEQDDDVPDKEEDTPTAQKASKKKQRSGQGNSDDEDGVSTGSDSEEEQSDEEEDDENVDKKARAKTSAAEKEEQDVDESENESDNDDDDDDDDDDSQASSDDEDNDKEESSMFSPFNKGLSVVTQELQAAKRNMLWVETFDIISKTPLPFGEAGTEAALDIHDDLKREVAFYDMALEAVQEARSKCETAQVPFTRPDDFFAEMVKTDEHMTRIKDRLIFETKKMDAVAQRKSNKEQKLRAKEAHSNKLVEKAKRKKDHFKAVQDWAAAQSSAESKRGSGKSKMDDDAFLRNLNKGGDNNNKKRMRADKKFGFGGKRGRFKSTDPNSLNDLSSFNRQGNFAQGMKKSPGGGAAGGKRPGKRARDASRARRN